MPPSDAGRRLVVERDLVRDAFTHLTSDAFLTLPFEALGPTKALLKRFFSPAPWGPADDEALATAVGPGHGRWRRRLADDLALVYGWDDDRFGVRVEATADAGSGEPAGEAPVGDERSLSLAGTFDGPVVPEATPNPRTIRFQVGAVHDGASRWFDSAAAATDDPAAARLFREFAEVANVLVGPDFVAVGLRRAADWERLLAPVLAVVTEEFASPAAPGDQRPARGERPTMGGPAGAGVPGASSSTHRRSRLEQAWHDLGSLRPADPDDLDRVRAAAAGDDPSRRQVAANLLREADADAAAAEWAGLVSDPVRSVRRAAVDAMVDAGRPALRSLLETALADDDPWVRWKALRGLAELGPEPSREAIADRADDPDFRVRLEAAAALRPHQ